MNVLKPPEGKSCIEFLVRILFIYQKIEEGWIVRKKEDDTFEFIKPIDKNNNESFSF